MRRCGGVAWAAVIAVYGAAFPAAAGGQTTAQRDGFSFGPTSVAVAFDSGLTVVSTSPFGDQLIDVTPTTVAYRKSLRRGGVSFSYEPRIEVYGAGSVFNSLDQRARGTYQTSLSRSLSLNINGTFLRTNDRSRQQGNLQLVPRGRYVRGNVAAMVNYSINTDTSLGFRLNAALTETALTPLATAEESLRQFSNVAGVNLSRTLSRSHSITARYSSLRTSTEDPRFPGQRTSRSGNLGVGYRLNTRFEFSLGATVGLIHRQNGTYSYSFSFVASKQWGGLSFNARYARTIAGLLFIDPSNIDPSGQISDPTLINSTIQNARLGITGEFARRVSLTQNLQWARTPLSAGQSEYFENLAGNTRVAVRAGNTVAPYVNLTYWLQSSAASLPTTSRFRISAGLQFYWNRLVNAPGPGS